MAVRITRLPALKNHLLRRRKICGAIAQHIVDRGGHPILPRTERAVVNNAEADIAFGQALHECRDGVGPARRFPVDVHVKERQRSARAFLDRIRPAELIVDPLRCCRSRKILDVAELHIGEISSVYRENRLYVIRRFVVREMAAILVFIGGIGFINGNIRNDAACSSNTCGNIFGKIVTALRQVSFNIVAFRLQSAAIRAVARPRFRRQF